jgi:hypothetical protein
MSREFIAHSTKMLHFPARLSASALSHHSLSLADFITNIAESDFGYTHVPVPEFSRSGVSGAEAASALRLPDFASPADARALFQSAVDHCPHLYIEYPAAKLELRRLDGLAAPQRSNKPASVVHD